MLCRILTPNVLHPQWKSARQVSTAMDSVLQYLRSEECRRLQQDQPDLVDDIVRSSASGCKGLDLARLAFAQSEHHMDKSNWVSAIDAAETALSQCPSECSSGDASLAFEIEQAGKELRHRCLLASGNFSTALDLARKESKPASSLPEGITSWKSQFEATTRLGHICLAAGKSKEAHGAMQLARELDQQPFSTAEGGKDLDYDGSVLPMKPRDILAPTAVYRLGIFSFVKGQVSRSSREFQRAAMAAEAAHAQSLEEPGQSVSILLLQETSLSAFSGHVQSSLFRAQSVKQWRHSEEQLEKVLAKAEAISGQHHPRVQISLMHLAEAFAYMGKLTLAEGLYRSIMQALYVSGREASTPSLRQPQIVHSSLSCLHAWRYAQLLELLPKRDAECLQWKAQAQQQADAFILAGLENALGAITLFRNKGPKGTGVFVDNSCRVAMPCLRSLVSGRRGEFDPLENSS